MTMVESLPVAPSRAEPVRVDSSAGEGLQDERRQLVATEQLLLEEFGAVLGEERVRHDLAEVVHLYDAAPVRTYLPVLALRQVRERLRPLTQAASA